MTNSRLMGKAKDHKRVQRQEECKNKCANSKISKETPKWRKLDSTKTKSKHKNIIIKMNGSNDSERVEDVPLWSDKDGSPKGRKHKEPSYRKKDERKNEKRKSQNLCFKQDRQ